MRRITKLHEFSKDKPIIVQHDTNIKGQLTGYYVFIQDNKYAISSSWFADALRKLGYLVDNRAI